MESTLHYSIEKTHARISSLNFSFPFLLFGDRRKRLLQQGQKIPFH